MRDAEIRHSRVPLAQQDVLRLDVPVHDAMPMGVVERVSHLASDADGLLDRELRLRAEAISERLAFHVRHGVPEKAPASPESWTGRMCG